MGRLVSTASRTLRYRSSTHPAVPVSEPSISSPAYSPGRRLDDSIFYNTVVLGAMHLLHERMRSAASVSLADSGNTQDEYWTAEREFRGCMITAGLAAGA